MTRQLESLVEFWKARALDHEQMIGRMSQAAADLEAELEVAKLALENDEPELRAALEAAEAERDEHKDACRDITATADRFEAENRRLREALEQIKLIQPLTLEMLRKHGVVFDGPLGADPKNFQHVAFSIYSNLCEVDSIARNAFDE